MKKCNKCDKEIKRTTRGLCGTCYARLFRSTIQSEESKKRAYEWRKKYREENKEKIAKYRKTHRAKLRAQYKKSVAKHGRKYKPRSPEQVAKIQAIVDKTNNYKLERGCVDCGYNKHSHALDFDHVLEKNFNISPAARSGMDWDKLFAEIQLCEIRCANCHRIKTHERRLAQKN